VICAQAAGRPRVLLGRYVFVELDYQNQSFLPITTTPGVDAAFSAAPVPPADVDDLFDRYQACEFDETKGGPPIGARVAIVEGKFGLPPRSATSRL
jgi:transcription antitermination factor NusG